jgi:archaellum component FlaC
MAIYELSRDTDPSLIDKALQPLMDFVEDCEKQVRATRLELMNTNKEIISKQNTIKKLEKNNERYMTMVS